MDISVKNVPVEKVERLRQRAKRNHRSLQGELLALIDAAVAAEPSRLTVDEIAARVAKLGLSRRNEAVAQSAPTVAAKVVDASALVALLFNERARESVVPRLRDASLHAPSILEFEVASACLKKIHALPAERAALLEAFSLFHALSIETENVDLLQAIILAEQARLTLYDASYLWLAHALDIELVTLDAKLVRADRTLRKQRSGPRE